MTSDFTDSGIIARRMMEATAKLHKLAPKVAQAKQIKEFIGDLKKNALAKEVVKALKAGESATAADFHARATWSYQNDLDALAVKYEAAEAILAEWSATQATFDAARSLLSFSKATLQELNG